jgi:multidrug resistance efflux pump
MLKAQANLGLAQSNYQRDLEVFKPGYISKAAFDTTKAQLRSLKAKSRFRPRSRLS